MEVNKVLFLKVACLCLREVARQIAYVRTIQKWQVYNQVISFTCSRSGTKILQITIAVCTKWNSQVFSSVPRGYK